MYKTKSLLALSTIIIGQLANALPTLESRNSCKFYSYTDTFDNYTSSVVLPEAAPVNYDGGLYYYFGAVPAQVAGVGLIPQSSPNCAAASIDQDLSKLNTVTLNPFGVITTQGTSTKYFQLVEFYYACLVFDNGTPVVTGCGLDIYGYDIYNNRIPSVSYNYAPTNEVAARMDRAVLPISYALLQNVTFAISTATVATTGTVLYLDNVSHINCQ